MSLVSIAPVTEPGFHIDPSQQDTTVTLRFSGNGDMRAIKLLDNFLIKLHIEAVQAGITQAIVDFRELEFMNSSCFKSFVTWLSSVQELAPEKQYRITFQSNPGLHWQKRSLHALRCFAADLVQVEV